MHSRTHRGIFNRLVLVTHTHTHIRTHRGIFNRLVLVTYPHTHAHTYAHREEYSTDSC